MKESSSTPGGQNGTGGGGNLTRSSRHNPCPVCGRTKDGKCTTTDDGLALCWRGTSHHPPQWADRKGDHGTGSDGQQWAFLGDVDGWGQFKPHEPKPSKPVRPMARRSWTYSDRDGHPLITVNRIDDGSGKRELWQESKVPDSKPADLLGQAVPYGHREAIEALANGAPVVFWVEGEPCVDALQRLGLPAVTSIGGASKFNPARDGGLFPADRLVIAPDRDHVGIKHAHQIAAAYPGARWLLCWPDQPHLWNGSCPKAHGLDVADWIEAGATTEVILAAITDTAPQLPTQEPDGSTAPKATGKDVAATIRQALADDIEGTALELLIQQQAQASGLHTVEVRRIAQSLEAEAARQAGAAVSIAAEARQLQARAAHRRAGTAITLEHLFPAPIAEALALRTRYLPADPCAVAVLFLPSIASLQKIGSRITGNPSSGYDQPLNLWGGVVAKSGQKKTPLLRRVLLDPTAEVRQALADGNRRDHQQWKDDCKLKPKGEPKPDPPKPVRLHVGDVTGEALAAELVNCDERKRGLLVLRDELAGLFSGLNQYKGGGGNDGQFLLELFDGGGHTSLRISGAREFSDSLVSITGCMQPPVLAGLVNASTGDADGRYARFMFAPLTQPPKPLPVVIDPAQQQAIDRAGRYLQQVAAEVHRAPARHLHLDPQALEWFARYEHQQALAADAATIPAQGAVLGKAAGKVLRSAGLLHLLDQIASGRADLAVGLDPLLRAIDLVDHLNQWMLSLHAELVSGTGPNGLMRKLHETAQAVKCSVRWAKFRDRLTPGQRKAWDREGFEAAAHALVELGCGCLEHGQRGSIGYVATDELP